MNCPTRSGFELPNAKTCGRVDEDLYEVRIVDGNDTELPPGVPGEAVVRPKKPWMTMEGYWNHPEWTVTAWRNLWLHTGDMLMRDESGNLYFVDRVKDAIRRRGENISSMEVEQEINTHPAVLECAVIPIASDETEQEVKAVIVTRPNEQPAPEALIAFLAERLPYFMVPRYLEFASELPKTPTGKIQKFAARTRHDAGDMDRVAAGVKLNLMTHSEEVMQDRIVLRRDGAIATMLFNRPERLNAMTIEIWQLMGRMLAELGEDRAIRCLVLAGEGRAFLAGHDVAEIREHNEMMAAGKLSASQLREWQKALQNTTRYMRLVPFPVIAAVQGYAVGAGCEVVFACDLVVASEDARFGFPEVNIGVTITNGGSYFAPRKVGLAKARELAYTGEFIDAQEAHRIGLVNCVVPVGQVRAEAERWPSASPAVRPWRCNCIRRCWTAAWNRRSRRCFRSRPKRWCRPR